MKIPIAPLGIEPKLHYNLECRSIHTVLRWQLGCRLSLIQRKAEYQSCFILPKDTTTLSLKDTIVEESSDGHP